MLVLGVRQQIVVCIAELALFVRVLNTLSQGFQFAPVHFLFGGRVGKEMSKHMDDFSARLCSVLLITLFENLEEQVISEATLGAGGQRRICAYETFNITVDYFEATGETRKVLPHRQFVEVGLPYGFH